MSALIYFKKGSKKLLLLARVSTSYHRSRKNIIIEFISCVYLELVTTLEDCLWISLEKQGRNFCFCLTKVFAVSLSNTLCLSNVEGFVRLS